MNNILDAIEQMVKWAGKNITHKSLQEIHNKLHESGGDCAHIHFFAYSIGEMNKASNDIHNAILSFINARMAMERAAEAINENTDGGLSLPPPPIQIAELADGSVNIGINQPHDQQSEKPNHDFSINIPGTGGKYSMN